ncbi:unnamed protein product [Thelazia callipaeda]|uniref:C2H2-type domain-containing protein n=1 Tax=Thelazia callipaeda TaxID=103827 RepID=A0A0N5D2Y8_THECL|nr:unnamed protein product [Thelazia callipaeda]
MVLIAYWSFYLRYGLYPVFGIAVLIQYCNREFEDEKILIQHQKAKHFKCHICHKKLFTGPGLAIHCMQVHKETIDKIPAALPGKDSVEVEVYGMEGIPDDNLGFKKIDFLFIIDETPKKEPKMSNNPVPPPIAPFPMLPPGIPPMIPGFPPIPPAGLPPFAPPFMPGMPAPPRTLPALPVVPPSKIGNCCYSIGMPPRTPLPPNGPVSVPAVTTAGAVATQPPPASVPAAFPAYSDPSSSKPIESERKFQMPSLCQKLGAKIHIMHPDEDLSLEERLAISKGYI